VLYIAYNFSLVSLCNVQERQCAKMQCKLSAFWYTQKFPPPVGHSWMWYKCIGLSAQGYRSKQANVNRLNVGYDKCCGAHTITDTKVHLRTSLPNATVGTSSRRVSYLRGRGFDSRLGGRSSCQAFHCFLPSLQANSYAVGPTLQ
jgi:hypothetical protein